MTDHVPLHLKLISCLKQRFGCFLLVCRQFPFTDCKETSTCIFSKNLKKTISVHLQKGLLMCQYYNCDSLLPNHRMEQLIN